MVAPIHPHRRLAKALTAGQKGGTPLRHARGVVISSNSGQTVVTLDGGTTHITAFNYGHTTNLAAGTVVDVLLVGKKAYVLGAYAFAGQPRLAYSPVTCMNGATLPAGTPLVRQEGSTVLTTNSGGYFILPFGYTFTTGYTCQVAPGDVASSLAFCPLVAGGSTNLSQVEGLAFAAGGATVNNAPVRLNWWAEGA